MDFDRFLGRFVTRMEKIMFRLVLVMLAALFVIQAVLINEDYRSLLNNTESFEGEPLNQEIQDVFGQTSPQGITHVGEEVFLTIELIPPFEVDPELFLLVNNRVVGRLGEHPLNISASPGDMLEVFGDVPGENPAIVRIIDVRGKVDSPEAGDEITTFGDRELLAWIVH